jgi:hypothetical protein
VVREGLTLKEYISLTDKSISRISRPGNTTAQALNFAVFCAVLRKRQGWKFGSRPHSEPADAFTTSSLTSSSLRAHVMMAIATKGSLFVVDRCHCRHRNFCTARQKYEAQGAFVVQIGR